MSRKEETLALRHSSRDEFTMESTLVVQRFNDDTTGAPISYYLKMAHVLSDGTEQHTMIGFTPDEYYQLINDLTDIELDEYYEVPEAERKMGVGYFDDGEKPVVSTDFNWYYDHPWPYEHKEGILDHTDCAILDL